MHGGPVSGRIMRNLTGILHPTGDGPGSAALAQHTYRRDFNAVQTHFWLPDMAKVGRA